MTMDDDHHVLAAEFVLGTLDPGEKARAEQLMANEPEFAALVRGWERRFGDLHALVTPVEPPPEVWDRIKPYLDTVPQLQSPRPRSIAAPPGETAGAAAPRPNDAPRVSRPRPPDGFVNPREPRAQIVALNARVRRWREAAMTFGTLAAGLAALLVLAALRPDLMPERFRPKPTERVVERVVEREVERVVEKTGDQPARFVAVLQRDAVSPAFILTVDVANRTMTVRRLVAESPPGRSYELWMISNRQLAPRSLGTIGAQEFVAPERLAAFDSETVHDAVYAITLEPEGGSPMGVPTGSVLWSGKLVESVPATAAKP
jgi:anti-sigma-K factor RskA